MDRCVVLLVSLRSHSPLYSESRKKASLLLWIETDEAPEHPGRLRIRNPNVYCTADPSSDHWNGLFPAFYGAQDRKSVV